MRELCFVSIYVKDAQNICFTFGEQGEYQDFRLDVLICSVTQTRDTHQIVLKVTGQLNAWNEESNQFNLRRRTTQYGSHVPL